MQYLMCHFPKSSKNYTYHNTGKPVRKGQKVLVMTDEGEKTIKVIKVLKKKPNFATKPILKGVSKRKKKVKEKRCDVCGFIHAKNSWSCPGAF